MQIFKGQTFPNCREMNDYLNKYMKFKNKPMKKEGGACFPESDERNREQFYYRSIYFKCVGYGKFISRGTVRENRNNELKSRKCECEVNIKIVAYRPDKKSPYQHLVVEDLFLNHNDTCMQKNYYIHPDELEIDENNAAAAVVHAPHARAINDVAAVNSSAKEIHAERHTIQKISRDEVTNADAPKLDLSASLAKLIFEDGDPKKESCFGDLVDESDDFSDGNITFETPPKERGRPQNSKTTDLIGKPIKTKERIFSKMDDFQKSLVLIRCLMPKEALRSIINKEYIINVNDLQIWNSENLSEAFLDEAVNISALRRWMSEDAFQYLHKIIAEKDRKFTCKECLKAEEGLMVGCDTCLLWFHALCVNYKPPKESEKKSTKNKETPPWFCKECVV